MAIKRAVAVAMLLSGLALWAAPAAAEHRVGAGVHYWRTVDDLAEENFDVDRDGLAKVLTYQYVPGGLLRLEVDLEYFDKGFGGSTDEAYSPQVYLLLGGGWYAGLGAGVTYSSDFENDFSDPFYAARVGLDMELLPRFHLDINANYRFDAWSALGDAGTDTVTLGALVRFGI